MTRAAAAARPGLSWTGALLGGAEAACVGAGAASWWGGHLLLTRPAGRLPTFMPGYIPKATMFHNPRYGHDLQLAGVALGAAGVAAALLTLALAVVRGGGDVVQRARRQLGLEGRFVGFTQHGQPIVEVGDVRLVYDRHSRAWRPRILCPTCERERTTGTITVASPADLGRVRTMGEWECRECQRRRGAELVGGSA